MRIWGFRGGACSPGFPSARVRTPTTPRLSPRRSRRGNAGSIPCGASPSARTGRRSPPGGARGRSSTGTLEAWRKLGGPLDGGGAPGALAFSADGALLAGARDVEGGAKVWDVSGESRKPTRLPLGGDLISRASVAFNLDGSTLAVAGRQGIRLWRTAGWDAHGRALQRGAGAVSRIAFSADGATLVAAGDVLRLWDPLRQQELGKPLGRPGFYSLEGLAVGAEGKSLLTAKGDGSVIRWDPILLSRNYAAWQKRLCPFAGRNLRAPSGRSTSRDSRTTAPAQGSRRAGSGRRSGTSWSPAARTAERGRRGAGGGEATRPQTQLIRLAALFLPRFRPRFRPRVLPSGPAPAPASGPASGPASCPASLPRSPRSAPLHPLPPLFQPLLRPSSGFSQRQRRERRDARLSRPRAE